MAKILLTGATSHTGYWFAKKLVASGHELVCAFSHLAACDYADLKQQRLQDLLPHITPAWGCQFGDDRFLEIAESSDILCHHGAYVTNYKSPDFDYLAAVQINTRGIEKLFASLEKKGTPCLVTGTVFEFDEGAPAPVPAASPYGLSKGLTWQIFNHFGWRYNIPVSKFVISNPFGRLEERKFCHYLMEKWRNQETAMVNTPEYVRDNIPVTLLALHYSHTVSQVLSASDKRVVARPHHYSMSQKAFTERVAKETRQRTNLPCSVDFKTQTVFSEPIRRLNSGDLPSMEWNETEFWDDYIAYYFGK